MQVQGSRFPSVAQYQWRCGRMVRHTTHIRGHLLVYASSILANATITQGTRLSRKSVHVSEKLGLTEVQWHPIAKATYGFESHPLCFGIFILIFEAMETKPIFIIRLGVGNLSADDIYPYINKCIEQNQNNFQGWTVLYVPNRQSAEITFEAFSANNLTEIQQSQLDEMELQMRTFLILYKQNNPSEPICLQHEDAEQELTDLWNAGKL